MEHPPSPNRIPGYDLDALVHPSADGSSHRLGLGVLACLAAAVGILALGSGVFRRAAGPLASGPLPQEAYVWQRQWTEAVRAAAGRAVEPGSPLGGVCVFYAEISPPLERELTAAGVLAAPPAVTRAGDVDWAGLARGSRPVGLAVRVREFPGEVGTEREPYPTLVKTVDEGLARATAAGVRVAEVQVDFDCPTAKLKGFATWLEALRAAHPGETFRFTALPSWLRSAEFPALARAAGGYVLQVHNLDKARAGGPPPTTLCDPREAVAAVDRAARVGVPFRVALPTYGYRLTLDPRGRLLGATAETAVMDRVRPPPGGSVEMLSAQPGELAGLVARWTRERPAALRGVLWYRLPVAGERLNWTWPTLAAVAAGRTPRAKITWTLSAPLEGQSELSLRNTGDADAKLPPTLTVTCPVAPASADAINGYSLDARDPQAPRNLVFQLRDPGRELARRLAPEESLPIAWVRLEEDLPVTPDELLGELGDLPPETGNPPKE